MISSITTDAGTQTNGRTIDPTISLNGTAEANSTVTLSRTGIGVIGTTSANGAGMWSFDYTGTSLPRGSYPFSATAGRCSRQHQLGSEQFYRYCACDVV